MTTEETRRIPDPILADLEVRCGSTRHPVSLESFIELALYHPQLGYYNRPEQRVGHNDTSDFYTASSLGPVFAMLVVAAIRSRLRTSLDQFTFIEIGPETESGIIGQLDSHPFRSCRVIRRGDPLEFPARSIVFSNELFDAQPFRRFVREEGEWRETAVRVRDGRLETHLVPPFRKPPDLPARAPEGYTIDWPSGAHALLESICQKSWGGLFLAFDYGLEQPTVFQQRPDGTGRTYAGHTMGTDLLEQPGQRDITCHVIWEQLESILARWQFEDIRLQRQEAFFMHWSESTLQRLIEGAPPGFSREKQTLMELLHPDNMGHKFQVLHALRGDL